MTSHLGICVFCKRLFGRVYYKVSCGREALFKLVYHRIVYVSIFLYVKKLTKKVKSIFSLSPLLIRLFGGDAFLRFFKKVKKQIEQKTQRKEVYKKGPPVREVL